MIYARNTAAIGIGNIGVNLDRVVVSFLSGPPLPSASPYIPRTIYEIQHTTSASGNSPYKDSLVEATGIVTGTLSNGYFIQDSAKSWNGIYVFDNINTPSRGDKITVRAKVNEYFNLTQLKSVDTVILVSSGNALPVSIGINTTELSAEEKYEGVLCKVSAGLCVNASAGNGEWYFINTTDTAVVDDLMYAFVPALAQKYDVTGVVYYSFGEYKIEPRDSNDVVFINTTSINENKNELDFSIYPNPVNSVVTISGLNLEKAEIYSVNGKLIKKVPLSVLNTIDVTDLENGIYVIKVIANNKVGISRFVKQ
jgi:predicted extracellular nuclease